MTSRKTPPKSSPPRKATDEAARATIPATDVGVTLKVSEEALKRLDQIQEQTVKAAQEDQKFSWR